MTTTSTDATLPTLTQVETDAAIAVAWGEPATLLQIAAKLKLAPDELAEILERPHVVAFTRAARQLQHMREEIVARREQVAGLTTLAQIAQDREADTETRLRAAIAILQGVRAGPTLPAGASARPRQPLSPASAPRLSLPAPPKPPPSPMALRDTPTIEAGAARAQPHHPATNQPSPASTSNPEPAPSAPAARTPAAPIALHHAAGAPIARRADANNRGIHLAPRPAPPPAPDRPP